MRDILTSDRLYERFRQLIDEPRSSDTMYVYRMRGEELIKPALLVGMPFSWLLPWLRDEQHGGDFAVIIRRGEMMLLAGSISVELPRAHHIK